MTTATIRTTTDADFDRTFVYRDVDANVINLAGATFEMMLRIHADDVQSQLLVSSANGRITIVDAAAGKFRIRVPQAVLELLPAKTYAQSLIMTKGSDKTQIWDGTWEHAMGPTR
jgi:hypothetical protein